MPQPTFFADPVDFVSNGATFSLRDACRGVEGAQSMSIQVAASGRGLFVAFSVLFAAPAFGFGILVAVPSASAQPAAPVVLCGDPTGDGNVRAADALYALKAAVQSLTCELWFCDADGNGTVAAADALRILKYSVGQPITLSCPSPPTTTTTTTTTSSTTSSSTTTTTTTLPPTTTTTTTLPPTTTTTTSTTTTTTSTTTTTLAPTTTTTLPTGPDSILLTLTSNVTTSGSSVGFTTNVLDTVGNPVVPKPTVLLTIEAGGMTSGPDPTIGVDTIVVPANTTGVYVVTATVAATSITDEETLTVLEPSPLNAELSGFGELLPESSAALFAAASAAGAGDTTGFDAARAALAAALAALDLEKLELVPPIAPPGGFPPSLGAVAGAGYGQTPADAQYIATLQAILAAINDLLATFAALDPTDITDPQIQALEAKAAAFATLADTLSAIPPTLYGGIDATSLLTVLVGRRLPQLLETILLTAIASTDSVTVDATPRPLPLTLDWLLEVLGPREAEASLLFDLVGAMNIQGTLVNISQQVYGKFIEDIENMVALLILEGLLDDYTGSGLCEAVSGASLSFITPEQPDSFLEGIGFNPTPELNQLLFIGPEAPQQVTSLISSFNPSEVEDLSDLYDFFSGIEEAFSSAQEAYDNANRKPYAYYPYSGFLCDYDYELLYLAEGFPDVLGDCTICISPILILQHDVASGSWSMITKNMVR